jgi:hypothetical protein
MNDRIKELAEQAGFTVENGHIQSLAYKQTEKFAELIIRECVRVMYDNAIERKVGLDIDKRPTYYAAAILEHFGAKE